MQLYNRLQHEPDSLGMLAPELPYFSSGPHTGSYSDQQAFQQSPNNQQQATYPQQGPDDNQLSYSLQQDSFSPHANTAQPGVASQQADGAITLIVSQPFSAACVQQPAAISQKDSSALSKTTLRPEWDQTSAVRPSTQQMTIDSCTAGSEHGSDGVLLLRPVPCEGSAEQQEVHESLPEANSRDCSHNYNDAIVDDPFDDDRFTWGHAKQQVHTMHCTCSYT